MRRELNIFWKSLPRYLLLLSFTSTVTSLIINAKSPCDSIDLKSYEGIITSPNYPEPYPDEVECEWKIRPPRNSALNIRIIDLDIKEDDDCPQSPCCSHHRLSISRDEGSILLCGNNTVERTITIFQPLTVIKYFSTKTKKRERGFKITYSMNVHTCKANEFPCMNGKCSPISSFCNGYNDCGDGSDELNCWHVSHAARHNPLRKNHANSGFVTQELCKEGTVQCPLSPDHCYSPLTDACDDKFDCPKGEDEADCVPGCPKQISCSSGDGCYYPPQRCNSIRNCRDNSDETGCPLEPCVAMQFTCLNGACVSGSAVCDGDDDCGDLSDEENCAKSSFMKAAVVGLLTCIMLFCIVLGCMYHVYTSRLRASANFVRQLEAEASDDDFIIREPPPAYSVADPAIMTYPSSEVAERYFDNDQAMQFQSIRRNRRRQHFAGSESVSTPRPRPSCAGGTVSQQKTDDKAQEGGGNRSNFRQFRGLNEPILPTNSCRNESPCSSLSLSPSRESVTSCTSLEELEDLVSLFQH